MSIQGYFIPIEVLYVQGVIYGLLILCSTTFWLVGRVRKNPLTAELITRTNSWWKIVVGITLVITAPKIVGTLVIAYVSFVALREVLSIGKLRESDRAAMFAAYFSIPVQYYLAYHGHYAQFLYFIPLGMFIGLAVILVVRGNTLAIGRSMSIIPAILILTVYTLSHMVLLYDVEVPSFTAGGGGLIIFLIMLTSLNDVFQFTWGKLLGRHKILPKVSPNKTWEGFVGGAVSTAILGGVLSFLTPLRQYEAVIVGVVTGVMGFFGDAIISAVKRDLELKDTDDLIPGHGGAMDRLDSLLITTPVYYHLLVFFIHR